MHIDLGKFSINQCALFNPPITMPIIRNAMPITSKLATAEDQNQLQYFLFSLTTIVH